MFDVGTRVFYSGAWGSRVPQLATITGYGEKNGRLVYDCRLDNGACHWGYANQFRGPVWSVGQ